MTRDIFKVTRGIEDSMSLVSATVQVSFIERVSQIEYGTAPLHSSSMRRAPLLRRLH